MHVMYERCAAIDVHQKTAVTTALITQPDGSLQKQTRTFATMTSDAARFRGVAASARYQGGSHGVDGSVLAPHF